MNSLLKMLNETKFHLKTKLYHDMTHSLFLISEFQEEPHPRSKIHITTIIKIYPLVIYRETRKYTHKTEIIKPTRFWSGSIFYVTVTIKYTNFQQTILIKYKLWKLSNYVDNIKDYDFLCYYQNFWHSMAVFLIDLNRLLDYC